MATRLEDDEDLHAECCRVYEYTNDRYGEAKAMTMVFRTIEKRYAISRAPTPEQREAPAKRYEAAAKAMQSWPRAESVDAEVEAAAQPTATKPCETCGGSKSIPRDPNRNDWTPIDCPTCHGEGKVPA